MRIAQRLSPILLMAAPVLFGQAPPNPNAAATAEDHQDMMNQLGIKALRPGPSGTETAPNHANYDEATANPYPNLPDVLTLKNGKKVTAPDMWWKQRRPEIIEDFDREVLGRVPKNVPYVTWTVTRTTNAMVGSHAVVGKQLTGHVDNSKYPGITVDIQMTLVVPADARGGSMLTVSTSITSLSFRTSPRSSSVARPVTSTIEPASKLATWSRNESG